MADRHASGRAGSWLLRVAAVLALTAMAWLAAAGSASAHARLISSDPPAEGVLADPPTHVRLTFSEPVQVAPDGVRIFDPTGQRVDDGRVAHPGGEGSVVQVGLRDATALGSYTVSWRVISADAHPIAGAFTFAVGQPSAAAPPAGATPSGNDPAVAALYTLFGALGFAAFAVLVGSVAFALACSPGSLRRSAVRRLAVGGWAGLLTASVATLLLYGPYANGQGLGSTLSPGAVAGTLDLPLGSALAGRLLLLAVVAVYLGEAFARLPSASRHARTALAAAGAVLATALATTWAAAGHARTGIQPGIALPVDVVHLLAMAVWLGGLATLTVLLWRAPEAPAGRELAEAVGRFSRIAFGAVVVLVGTGTYQSWRQLGSWSAFATTDYGRLLLLKLILVAAILAAASFSRRAAARMRDPRPKTLTAAVARDGPTVQTLSPPAAPPVLPSRTVLRRSVAVEGAVAALVLAATAVLVTTEPGRTVLAEMAGPLHTTVAYDTGGPSGAGTMEVEVDPAGAGPNVVRITVRDSGGAPRDVAELGVAFTLEARDLGPLRFDVEPAGAGGYRASGQLPVAGTWQLALAVRTSDIDQTTVRIPVEVRGR